MRIALVAACVLFSGCGFEPEGSVTFDPPSIYRTWWAETQACSGTKGGFSAISWAYVPGRAFACPSGNCMGRWEPGQRIYLAEAFREHELVVRHEMLHALLGRSGHPNPPFGRGCPLTWETWFLEGRPDLGPVID